MIMMPEMTIVIMVDNKPDATTHSIYRNNSNHDFKPDSTTQLVSDTIRLTVDGHVSQLVWGKHCHHHHDVDDDTGDDDNDSDDDDDDSDDGNDTDDDDDDTDDSDDDDDGDDTDDGDDAADDDDVMVVEEFVEHLLFLFICRETIQIYSWQ